MIYENIVSAFLKVLIKQVKPHGALELESRLKKYTIAVFVIFH